MMRSMYAGVSGLRAHQIQMDVIGNNIANVNTIGYRASRVTFQEVFNQTIKGAGAPDGLSGRGGTNPIQIGLGASVASVDMITSRGSFQRTDNPTDLSIEGEGFFIVKGSHGETFTFTRAGNFGIDKHGYLVTSNGKYVYGWHDYGGAPDAYGIYTFDTDKTIEPLNIYTDIYNHNKRTIAAKATEHASLLGNLDATMPVADPSAIPPYPPQFSVPINVYDALGNEYQVYMHFWKTNIDDTGPSTTWTWEISTLTGTVSDTIEFNEFGQIISGQTYDVTFEPDAATVGTSPFTVKFDFSNITMFAADSSVKPLSVDGYPTGTLVTINIGSDGVITGVYSNGKQQPLGLIALATFENQAGLQRVGDNEFMPTTNSGDFKRAIRPGTDGAGMLNPGTLEMSNVDLAKQFTDMIITQRGFQANSRIMTTADEMLQELANMKR